MHKPGDMTRERGDYLRTLPAFEQGRMASRMNADPNDAPEDNDACEAWLFGYDYEDGLDG